MPPATPTTIFVYGTLKRRGENHHHLTAQTFLGEARTVAGYRLFELDGYPGMIAVGSWDGSVTGEVWRVDPACLARLDELEGLAEGLYRRVPVALFPPFEHAEAETYVYARTVEGRRALGETWSV